VLCETKLGEIKIYGPVPSLRDTPMQVKSEHRLAVDMGV